MRLDKFLALTGFGTRTEVKKLVKGGRVTINGERALKPETKVDPEKDEVTVDGVSIRYEENLYYLLNKPAGCVSAVTDHRQQTVMDLFDEEDYRDGLFPVGRLDIDTEGLLLITDDGKLSHELLAPGKHVDKTYIAVIEGELPSDSAERFEQGLDIGDEKMTMPAVLKVLTQNDAYVPAILEKHPEAKDLTITSVVLHEGRFHQVKRMFEALGCKVVYLKRVSMGPLTLDHDLEEGSYRRLTEQEMESIGRSNQKSR